jgi:hypothetical protein
MKCLTQALLSSYLLLSEVFKMILNHFWTQKMNGLHKLKPEHFCISAVHELCMVSGLVWSIQKIWDIPTVRSQEWEKSAKFTIEPAPESMQRPEGFLEASWLWPKFISLGLILSQTIWSVASSHIGSVEYSQMKLPTWWANGLNFKSHGPHGGIKRRNTMVGTNMAQIGWSH